MDGGAGRVTKRNQLRYEGVPEYNPAGNAPLQLSRQSEKQVKKKGSSGGCCGSKKD